MIRTIPYGRQSINVLDVRAVQQALSSDWLTQGPRVGEFEEALASYTGARYCVVLSNGTAALHAALWAIGIRSGDEVVTSPITFAASANAAVYVGAHPKFVDIDKQTYHMDLDQLEKCLSQPAWVKKVKVIIPVHYMGTVVDMPRLRRICKKKDIKILEDAAHALGAAYTYKGKNFKVGSAAHSDAVMLSFHPIKQMTTGEGGAVLTNDKTLYENLLRLRHHGIVKGAGTASVALKPYAKEPWFYDIPEVGYNFRLTDMQSALGLSQLKRLDRFVNERRKLVKKYNEAFQALKQVILPCEREGSLGSYHLYPIRVPANRRSDLHIYLKRQGIATQVNYIPVHLLTAYQRLLGHRWGDFPVAEQFFQETLSLPLFVGLTHQQQNKIIKSVKAFFAHE